MNNHHPLCYNDEWEDPECDLCFVIAYIIEKLIPPCTCGSAYGSPMTHHVGCKHGAFFYSQLDRNTL